MFLIDHPLYLFVCFFAVLFVAVEVGFRLRSLTAVKASEERHAQIVGTRDGILVLLSLLLGFTLAMALTRYDLRKELLVDEANAIGTTGLRAQMLSEPARAKTLDLLRQYARTRQSFSAARPGTEGLTALLAQSKRLQNDLWQHAVSVAQQNPTAITSLFVASLNETIDLSEKQHASLENRIPISIWIMLILISLLACLTVGYSLPIRFLLSMVVPPLMIAIVITLIADLDSPRSGSIRVGVQSMERLQSDLSDGSAN
jgi:hypothetical protein